MNKHEKNIACCFTGHRKIPQKKSEQIQERLRNEIVTAIQNGYNFFYAGGAVGFDTMAALREELEKRGYNYAQY